MAEMAQTLEAIGFMGACTWRQGWARVWAVSITPKDVLKMLSFQSQQW